MIGVGERLRAKIQVHKLKQLSGLLSVSLRTQPQLPDGDTSRR